MRRPVKRLVKVNKNFTLQLTAMVDMFTILIVFLLKSFSTSSVTINLHKNLKVPISSSYTNPVEALKLIVALDGIYIDDNKVIELKDGALQRTDVDKSDPDFIRSLYSELDKQAVKSKGIAEQNKDHKFYGKIIMQADSRLNYALLKKVMYTSSLAGYADMKLATMSVD